MSGATGVKKRSRFLVLLPALSGIGLLLCARLSPAFAENFYARRLYPAYRSILIAITGKLPFSLAQWLLYALVPGTLAALTGWLLHIIKGKGNRWLLLRRGIARMICLLGVITLGFSLGGGGNYYRQTYAEASGLTVAPADVEELTALYADLTQRANALRSSLTDLEDEKGVLALPCSMRDLGGLASCAMEKLGESEPLLAFRYPAPKAVFYSEQLSRFGITGVFSPFTMEANVNVDAAPYSIAAAMCHELCHVAGFMREDEANYLAYRACTESGNDLLSYSGTMLALIYTGNALYKADRESYRRIRQTYCEGICRDLASDAEYWAQFEDTAAEELGERVNDLYLKANNQSSGTQSYGEMVDLLLAQYRISRQSAPSA